MWRLSSVVYVPLQHSERSEGQREATTLRSVEATLATPSSSSNARPWRFLDAFPSWNPNASTIAHCEGDSKRTRFIRTDSVQFVASREDIIRRTSNNRSDFQAAYEIQDEIAAGAFGRIYRVRHRVSGQIRAAKQIKKSALGKDQWNMFEAEVEFLSKLDHPNVVRLIEFFPDEDDNNSNADPSMFIILELCHGPDLFDHMAEVFTAEGSFPENRARVLLRGMLRSVLCCHCHNIVHRDIKPENFMFPTSNPNDPLKMIDLGLSERYIEGKSKLSGVIGTVGYMAPEVMEGKYSRECDIWSLGVIFYLMLTGRPLLPMDVDQPEVLKLLRADNGRYVPDQLRLRSRNLSRPAQDLLQAMLTIDPEKRITAQAALEHPFLLAGYEAESSPSVSPTDVTEYTEMSARLTHYSQESMLKRVALLLLAHIVDVDDASVKAAVHFFREIDTDGSGDLTTEEVRIAFNAKGVGLPNNWTEVIRRIDVNASGSINFVEWIAAMLPEKVYSLEPYLRAAFQFFDVRKCGEVTSDDIATVFPGLRDAPIESRRRVVLNAVGKSSFNFEDFKEMMLKDS